MWPGVRGITAPRWPLLTLLPLIQAGVCLACLAWSLFQDPAGAAGWAGGASAAGDPAGKRGGGADMVVDLAEARGQAKGMFQHAFSSYMRHGFPSDDVRPISCRGHNTQGGIALTLLDSLDTLLVRPERRVLPPLWAPQGRASC